MAKKVKRTTTKTRLSKDDLKSSLSRTGMTSGQGFGTFFSGGSNKEKEDVVKTLSNTVADIPIDQIHRNADQPRVDFDEVALQELSNSIKQLGIIQPITVRYVSENNYQIISGERRWRASKEAGLTVIPAFIRIADDQEMMEMALVENIQREDLNPWEVANTYQRLMDEFELTQEKVSDRVGKKRSTVANYLGLLKIENPEITKALKDGDISMGHGRELVAISDLFYQTVIFKSINREGLSVRATEKLTKLFRNNRDVFAKINADDANPKLKNALTIGDISFEQALELGKVDLHIYQNIFIDRIEDNELTLRELRDMVDFYQTNRIELEVAAKNIENTKEYRNENIDLEHVKELGRLTDQGMQDDVRTQVISKHLSLLQTQNLVDAYLGQKTTKNTAKVQLTADHESVKRKFQNFFGTGKINIKLKEDGAGQIVIPFEKDNKTLNNLKDLLDFAEENGFDINK